MTSLSTIPKQPSSPSVFIEDLTIQFLLNSTLSSHVILENTEYLSSILESAKFSYVRTKILNQVQDDVTELEVLGPRLIVNKTIPTQPSSPSVFIGDLTIQFLLNSTQ
ncbi:hypothetical protein BCT04_10175 [Vibrio breoganii]|nr:hypothetical protein BCT04_10175 [Vibrio breoganii]